MSSQDAAANPGEPLFEVVVNHEEQYSIWPAGRELPGGWTAVGQRRPREDCLAYIAEHWTDMRPLSLRAALDRDGPSADGQPAG